MIHILSKEKINKHFSDEKIQAYMRELGLTKLECILYLWFYNNAHVTLYDFKKDNGRPMFVRFAKSITDLINECKKDKTVLDEIEKIAQDKVNADCSLRNIDCNFYCNKCLFETLDKILQLIKQAKEE